MGVTSLDDMASTVRQNREGNWADVRIIMLILLCAYSMLITP